VFSEWADKSLAKNRDIYRSPCVSAPVNQARQKVCGKCTSNSCKCDRFDFTEVKILAQEEQNYA